jgi:hypothetical protein
MLEAGLLDRYILELPTDLVGSLKVTQTTRVLIRRETLVEKIRPAKKEEPKKKEDPNDPLKDAKQEISDAVAELVADLDIEEKPRITQPSVVYDAKRRMYSLMEQEHQVMDYSKLGYGKVAEPLSIEYKYQNYEQEDDGKQKFSATETLTTEEADKLIEKVVLAQQSASTVGLDPEAKERFEYYLLFNRALVAIKYDPFSSRSTQIDGGSGGNFRYIF